MVEINSLIKVLFVELVYSKEYVIKNYNFIKIINDSKGGRMHVYVDDD